MPTIRLAFEDSIQRSDASKDSSHRNRTKPTWESPRGVPCKPDSNRRAWSQTPGAGGRGVGSTKGGGRLLLLCVCVWGGAGCWEGRAHVRKRGIAWRGARREGGGCSSPAGGHRVWEGGLWLSLLFAACRALVDRSRAFACSLHRPDVRPTRVSATTSKRQQQQQREDLQRKAARAQARESNAMYTPRRGGRGGRGGGGRSGGGRGGGGRSGAGGRLRTPPRDTQSQPMAEPLL